jgi:hypothetical protein
MVSVIDVLCQLYAPAVAFRIGSCAFPRELPAMNVRQRTDTVGCRVFSFQLVINIGERHVHRRRHTRYDSHHCSHLLCDSQGMMRGHSIRHAVLLVVFTGD